MKESDWNSAEGMDENLKQIAEMSGMRLATNPYDVDALFMKGLLLAKLGNLDEAVEMLYGLLTRNPEYPGGWRVLGSLYEKLGDDERLKECIYLSSRYVE
jgi:predicted Zn-dependent protease